MTDAAPAIFIAIEGSSFAAAIRQSPFAYMTANVVHILSLMVFFGAVAVMDLRLAGFFSATWPGAAERPPPHRPRICFAVCREISRKGSAGNLP